jgi:hypothetical protein
MDTLLGSDGRHRPGSQANACSLFAATVALGILVVAIGSAAGAAAVAEAIVESPRREGIVNVDGRLDEAQWQDAAPVGAVVTLGALGPPQDGTEARLLHDGQALRVGIVCQAPAAADLPSLPRDHEGIWRHDRIEVFLDPTPDTEDYLHLVLDRAGNRLDSRHAAGVAAPSDRSWNADWDAATTQRPDGWSAEFAIPFAALGVDLPPAGSLWRLKICRDGGRDGPTSWPANPTGSFHKRDVDGLLYFEGANLLANGDFEEGEVADGAPPPWRPAVTSPEVDNAPQGTVETLADAGLDGGRALRMTKLATALWWPQVWTGPYPLEAGGVYEFSVMARGTLPTINLRATALADGQALKMSHPCAVPAAWERLRFIFGVPPRTTGVSIGLSAPAAIAGEVFLDQARLRRALASAGPLDTPMPLSTDADPDPVQGLNAFMERQGHKPWDLFQAGAELKTLRLIFHDRQFGTPVWMLDTSPTVDHNGTASVWSAWNPTASTLFVEGARYLDGVAQRGWFFNADFSRLLPARGGRPAVWSPEDPDVYYAPASPVDSITRNHWRTGEQRVLATWAALSWPASGQRLYGMTRDRRHLFVDLPNRGIFVPFTNDPAKPIPQLALYDGRPIGPGGQSVGANHYTTLLKHERFGDLIALRTGMLVDRQTGELTNIAAPLCGNTHYLLAFHEGRVQYPQGDEWNAYGLPGFAGTVRLPTGLSVEELYDLWRNLPHATHGHESPSPDWQHIATDGGATLIARVRDGQTTSVRVSPNGGNYHLHWVRHPRFLVGWVRGWHFGSYLRPQQANVEFQIFTDGTFQPIVDTKHRFNGYYSGGDFAMLSSDATKIHYGSSMTGRFRNYIAVMARPRPPIAVAAVADGNAVLLRWQPSAYSQETRGYFVYRGQTSGGGYELLTSAAVDGAEYRDTTAQPGRAYYYVVTSIEHAGLESGHSAEVAAGVALAHAPQGPFVVYAEAEEAVRDLGTEDRPGLAYGVDRKTASDWALLYRHPDAKEGGAALTIAVPATAHYALWLRLRNAGPGASRWEVRSGDRTIAVQADTTEWTWVRAAGEPLALTAGEAVLQVRTADATAQMDLLCLASAEAFVPPGRRLEKATAPPLLAGLVAATVQPRVNRLTWNPSPDSTVSHYNVYAATAPIPAPTQAHLVGSPTEAEFIDWGLRAGTAYYYAVTAVDRRGNESAPATATAATPTAPDPYYALLTFASADRQGRFEVAAGEATRGSAYVVPQEPSANAASWRLEVPRDGDYYLWLRYLPRGSGDRGGEVQQSIRVQVNGVAVLADLGGGGTDLHVPDSLLAAGHPLARQLWTWAYPGGADLQRVPLVAGTCVLTLDRLAANVRYDALAITDDPAWLPQDGRLRQR